MDLAHSFEVLLARHFTRINKNSGLRPRSVDEILWGITSKLFMLAIWDDILSSAGSFSNNYQIIFVMVANRRM